MKTTKQTFKAQNFNKPTPKLWKQIGNTALYTLPLLQGLVAGSPFSSDVRVWVGFGVGLLLVAAKGITKFFAYEEIKK